MSSSTVELAKQEIPNFEAPPDFRSNVLEPDRSSLEAFFDVLSSELLEDMEPFLGGTNKSSPILGLDPEGGDDPGDKLLLALV